MSDDILETMLNNLVVYVWNNPNDDEDYGCLLIGSEDLAVVQDLTENLESLVKRYEQANSFRDLKDLLDLEEISFFDLTDGLYIYNYIKE
jgi:hypothetical protein